MNFWKMEIRELYKATGGTFGGQNVNRQFMILLETIFNKSFIDNYARRNPVDWLHLMNDFEVKKRGKRICEGETTRIRLPVSFISKFPCHKGWDINTAIQQPYSLDEIKVVRNEYLCLEPKVIKQLFNPVLDDIISHLSNLFANQSCLRSSLHSSWAVLVTLLYSRKESIGISAKPIVF